MPLRILLFNAIQLAVCLYAWRRGGAPERLTAGIMAAAAGATALLPYVPGHSFHAVEWGELAIDGTMLVALAAVAARADRYWPMWIAALQLVAVSIHGVRAVDASILPMVYNRAGSRIAYAMILVLAVGTRRHLLRVRKGTTERDWSNVPWRLP